MHCLDYGVRVMILSNSQVHKKMDVTYLSVRNSAAVTLVLRVSLVPLWILFIIINRNNSFCSEINKVNLN